MAWVRIDTGFARHPKLLGITPADRWVHLAAMCWSAENHTDGRIPVVVLGAISSTAKRSASRLEAAGLWDPTDDGWVIHDWAEYNISAEESKRQLQAKRDRQRQWVAKQREARRNRNTKPVDVSVDASTDASKDVPPRARKTRPDPTPSSKEEGRVREVAATPESEPPAQAPPPPGQKTNGHHVQSPEHAVYGDRQSELAAFHHHAAGILNHLRGGNGTGRPDLTVIPGGPECSS